MGSYARIPRFVLCILVLCLASFSRDVQGLTVSADSENTPTLTSTETSTLPATETATDTSEPPSPTPSETTSPSEPSPSETATATLEAGLSASNEIAEPSSTFTVSPTITSSPTTQIAIPRLKGKYSNNQVLVTLRSSGSLQNINQCLTSISFQVTSTMEDLKTYLVQVPDGQVAESIAYLQNCKGIRNAEPDYMVQMANVIPNDPQWGNQYGLVAIRAPQGWQYATGSSSVTIAILDTGIQLNHPDLAGKIVAGYNVLNGTTNANDDNGHGTHVAGIAAAMTNNGKGMAGVSWGARLMPVKVLDASGNGTYADVIQGILWATDHGAQIINLSLGGTSASTPLENAVDYAYSHGVTLVASAGNSNSPVVDYPAHYPHVIAVVATDSSNNRWPSSNYGPEVSLAAPGVSILSTQYSSYGYRTGTSQSAAFVSGFAAILRGLSGGGTPDAIAAAMESTALDLGAPGFDDYYGYGLIQMDKAILLVQPSLAQPTSRPAPPALPGFSFFPAVLTPTPTYTSTSLVPSETATASLTPLPTITGTISATAPVTATSTAEVTALGTSESKPAINLADWQLPCCGSLLILLGLLLLVFLSHRRRNSRNHLQIALYSNRLK